MSQHLANRRGFLSNLGKALGAGGLLLPVGGTGAFSLPADLGQAAGVPVTRAKLQFSPEAIELRRIRDRLHEIHLSRTVRPDTGLWFKTMTKEYRPLAQTIRSRPNPTWADCVELAEHLWHILPKKTQVLERGSHQRCETLGELSVGSQNVPGTDAFVVALVEAVLALGEGERWDPRTDQGRFNKVVS